MAPQKIGAFEAKTRLSELLELVRQGRTFLITRRGTPIAELRPAGAGRPRLEFGADKGRVVVGKDFDTSLPGMDEYER